MEIGLNLPERLVKLCQKVELSKEQIYLVGGAVRDLLMNREIHDWDLTTSAKPEKILSLFPGNSFYNNQFGTVGVVFDKEVWEITTFRTEANYDDFRRPKTIQWGKSLEEDLQRRDFTINAIALKVGKKNGNLWTCLIIDPYLGIRDLKNKIVRAVGDPQERFKEDALRMIRAIRIACQLEFSLEEKTSQAIASQAELITKIAWERIGVEMIKIMESPRPEIGVALLKESGLLKWIAPELLEGLGVEQKGHHIYDVWTHNLRALSACKSKNPITRLAVLLHDIGKPRTLKVQKNGERTFYNHEVIGARMALEIAKRLRLPKVSQEQIFKLVRWHMFSADTVLTDSAVKRIIRNVGVEYLDELIALRQADRVGSGARETSWRWEALKKRFIEVQKQPFGVKDLKVNGKDVMEILRIKPGPRVGGILNELFSQVEADLNLNEREKLLDKIKEYVEK